MVNQSLRFTATLYRFAPLLIFYPAVLSFWYTIYENQGGLENVIRYWFMPVTMMFGSFIAGATSEGGGAVAFPVMTLVLKIHPLIARDFSLIIQSVGMTAASLWILRLGIPIEVKALAYGTCGGAVGMALGLFFVQDWFQPKYLKMFFVCVWLAYAWFLRRSASLGRQNSLPERLSFKEALLLFTFALIGGVVSSLTGSGLDIFTFSVLTLYFRVDEKIATPTSVILMAVNALIGTAFQISFSPQYLGGLEGLSALSISLWATCVPVVLIGAPLGSWFIKGKSREFIVAILISSIILQFLGGIFIVPHDLNLILFDLAVVGAGLLLFYLIFKGSQKKLDSERHGA